MNDQQTSPFPIVKDLTADIAGFIATTSYADIPEPVLEAGKKSILDGVGLALAGSIAKSGQIIKDYLVETSLSSMVQQPSSERRCVRRRALQLLRMRSAFMRMTSMIRNWPSARIVSTGC